MRLIMFNNLIKGRIVKGGMARERKISIGRQEKYWSN